MLLPLIFYMKPINMGRVTKDVGRNRKYSIEIDNVMWVSTDSILNLIGVGSG